jgi:hypothetical protein
MRPIVTPINRNLIRNLVMRDKVETLQVKHPTEDISKFPPSKKIKEIY